MVNLNTDDMLYTETSKNYEPSKEVIKLTIDVNTEHHPNFPKVVYVSEFNYNSVISKLMGFDISVKRSLNMSDDDYYKTWIAFGVKAEHQKNDKFFGINGNTMNYRWL